ncbi:MAG: hypothetical protein ABIP30_17415 [Ferruginibacter sp.]
MQLTDKHIKQFLGSYLAWFIIYYVWIFCTGLLFSQVQPVFFLNRLDLTGNILMLGNLQHLLIKSQSLRIIFDLLYLLLPCLLVFFNLKKSKAVPYIAIATAVFSFVYNYFYTLMIFVSPEVFVVWMFMPFIFSTCSIKGIYFRLHTVRIIFLVFFLSSALWKIRAGGIFNTDQMSGVLKSQHAPHLVNNISDWYAAMISWFISHPAISYTLYLFAFLAEFSFIVGFFTTRFDKYLLILFCMFIIGDYFFMEINYCSWFAFAGCLYFSRFNLIESKNIP